MAGIEFDPALVKQAERNLQAAGFEADIVVGDLFDPDLRLHGDVFFTYLAPASLQRLWPTLEPHRGTRLVSVDFDVPGRTPTKRNGPARLYRLPGRRRPVGDVGWESAGTLISTVPDCQSLSCLSLVHPGGTISVRVSANLRGAVAALPGADRLDAAAALAVDLRWEPLAEGTLLGGRVQVSGMPDHDVFVWVTDHEPEGVWELSADGVANLRRTLRRKVQPDSMTAILAAAEA